MDGCPCAYDAPYVFGVGPFPLKARHFRRLNLLEGNVVWLSGCLMTVILSSLRQVTSPQDPKSTAPSPLRWVLPIAAVSSSSALISAVRVSLLFLGQRGPHSKVDSHRRQMCHLLT